MKVQTEVNRGFYKAECMLIVYGDIEMHISLPKERSMYIKLSTVQKFVKLHLFIYSCDAKAEISAAITPVSQHPSEIILNCWLFVY